jgi:CxxC motif-containing protein (DUF1111 family)
MACRKPESISNDDYDERLSGGSNTVFDESSTAFSNSFPSLTGRNLLAHELGDASFERVFVSAPSPINPGLGPIYNNVSCISCHAADGRGKAPNVGEDLLSLLLRISVPGKDNHGAPMAVPGFGGQLQSHSIFGVKPEASIITNYDYQNSLLDDGTSVELRRPNYILTNPYEALPTNMEVSPRLAPPVFGLGLLEAISNADILANADEDDLDGNGVSGKANQVWNATKMISELGRFGWKAGQPNLKQQSAGAYNEDMGITNPIFRNESSLNQTQFTFPTYENNQTEINDSILSTVAFYMQTLAVPARRNVDDPAVLKGKSIFRNIGCNNCHVENFRTAVNVAFPALSNQLIHPYTDLLLHDMGEELADNRSEFLANGKEWRTPPLWGIGLTKKINGHTNFLHDGRARNFTEAILWHGGESQVSRKKFKALNYQDRLALQRFLESL